MAASGGELVGAEEGRKKERGKKKILRMHVQYQCVDEVKNLTVFKSDPQ